MKTTHSGCYINRASIILECNHEQTDTPINLHDSLKDINVFCRV